MTTAQIGTPYHNVRSWYFKIEDLGPNFWDNLVDTLQTELVKRLEFIEAADRWEEISDEQVAQIIAVVRPGVEISLNRLDKQFCLSVQVEDWYNNDNHEAADHVADQIDVAIREILPDIYCNPL